MYAEKDLQKGITSDQALANSHNKISENFNDSGCAKDLQNRSVDQSNSLYSSEDEDDFIGDSYDRLQDENKRTWLGVGVKSKYGLLQWSVIPIISCTTVMIGVYMNT